MGEDELGERRRGDTLIGKRDTCSRMMTVFFFLKQK
jgi:hypothetical protein